MSVLPNDYDGDPERFLASGKYPHDDGSSLRRGTLARAGTRRVLDVGGGNGRLARLLPGLSMSCLPIDLSPAMLALAPRPAVRADAEAAAAASTLDLPLTLTMRGCFVYATKTLRSKVRPRAGDR